MKTKMRKLIALSLVLTLVVANVAATQHAHAATYITNSYIRLNRMSAGATTSFRLVFKTNATLNASATLAINFNGVDTTTWSGSSGAVNAAQTISSTACAAETPSAGTALPGTLTAAGASNTVTISGITATAINTTYCVDLTSATAVTNATAGEYHPTLTYGIDSNTVAVRTISNDQVVVSAIVPPTFNLALSGNTDSFTTNLGAGSVVDTTGVTATVNTNAKTGWYAWAKDSNAGLTSATQSKTIASTSPGAVTVQTLAAGTEGYLLGITAITQGTGAGTTSATGGYDGTGGAGKGAGLDTTIRQIASSTGTANTAVLTLKERAAINAVTPAAADYTDTLTIIAAGSF